MATGIGAWTRPLALLGLWLLVGTATAVAAATERPPTATEARTTEARNIGEAGERANGARVGARRRVSYASCNRESHRRNLRGGPRRRFLIRCRLGYDRRQPGRAGEPGPAGRRP